MIYVPYFNDDEGRNAAIAQIKGLESTISNSRQKYVLIGYHGNPFPNLMENEKLHARVDHNLIVIQSVVDTVLRTKGEQQKIKIICGHLHYSNDNYSWPGRENITICPIGTKEIIYFDAKTNDLKKENF